MTIVIETASTQHLERLYEIENECFKEDAFSRLQIASLLRDYNSIGLVAIENNRIVGFVIGMIDVKRNALDGHILTIDVSPQYQRKGIGLKLLQAIEKIFMERDVKRCYLEAREDNIKALGLYERSGYKKIGKLKNYYREADGLYLCKNLA
jgi:ribosomal-protein-alanine N-acetyltransferase